MAKKYGIMLIGCGNIGAQHLEQLYYREELSIEAVIDKNIECAKEFAEKYKATHYDTDYHKYLKSPYVDIVIVATYTNTHLLISKECLEAGKHVLCEKPIATNLKDAQEFYNMVKNAKAKLLVAHILRHNTSYMKIADMIDTGLIGDLRLMRMVQNHHALNWARYNRLIKDCHPLVDCGVHYLDVMQWFTKSKITEVSAISTKLDSDACNDNYGMLHVKLQNGCIANYEAGWGKNIASDNTKEFIGTKGRIRLTLYENRVDNREEGDLISVYLYEKNEYKTINVNSIYKNMYLQMRTLIDMIENDAPANPNIDEVFSSFKAAMMAMESIKKGKVIMSTDE